MQASMITQLFLPIALFIIMLSVGLALTLADFKRVLKYPRAVFFGITAQFFLLPLLGIWVVWIFDLPLMLALGLIILTLAPGGATSNAITLLARGDAALSVSLTALLSVITPFTLPLMTALLLKITLEDDVSIAFPVGQALMQMLLITLVPVLLGMVFRHRYLAITQRIEKAIRRLAFLLMVATVIMLVVSRWPMLMQVLPILYLPVFTLVLLAMLMGYGVAVLGRLDDPQRVSLTIEVGLQNAGTALLVTGALLQNAEMSASALTYGVLMQLPAFALIAWRNRDVFIRQAKVVT